MSENDSDVKSNVIGIEKAGDKDQAKKAKGLSQTELIDLIALAVMGKPKIMGRGPYPKETYKMWAATEPEEEIKNIRVYRRPDGLAVPCAVSDQNIVSHITKEVATQKIRAYMGNLAEKWPIFGIPRRSATDVCDVFACNPKADPIKETDIKDIAQLSDPGLCYDRLDFDIEEKDWSHVETPGGKINYGDCAFLEFFSRCSNWKALAAFIGSVFDQSSAQQQYVWIKGEGGDGKSSIANLLSRMIEHAYHTEDVNGGKMNQFATHALLGKRLVVFPDCNNSRFAMGGKFKNMTGGDRVRIEEKGGKTWSQSLRAKYMFLSNNKLEITKGRADRRRAIAVEVVLRDKTDDDDAESFKEGAVYDEKLWGERAEFVSFCWYHYLKIGKGRGRILVPEDSYDSTFDADGAIEEFCENHFLFSPTHEMTPNEMTAIFREFKVLDQRDRYEKFLEREKKIKKVRPRDGGTRQRVWIGIKAKVLRTSVLPNTPQDRGW